MAPIALSRQDACRIAIAGQLLTAERPQSLQEVLHGLCSLQLDQASPVMPSADLVAWSRLGGGYRPDQLAVGPGDGPRTVFEYRNLAYPMSDLDLWRPVMAAWPDGDSGWHARIRRWLEVNDSFRRYVLAELERNGPMQAKDLDDRAVESWASSGWNNNRNVPLMLEFLEAQGHVAVTRREKRQRVWDLASRVYPAPADAPSAEDAAAERRRRRMRWLGIARAKVADGAGVPVSIDGVPGEWRVDPDLARGVLDGGFDGRTAMLSPFDRLVYDRDRLRDLFGFDYCVEMYIPAAKRRWGYYAMPVLHHDRFVGAVDAKAKRATSTLDVLSIRVEPDTGFEELQAIDDEIDALAAWVGLEHVSRP